MDMQLLDGLLQELRRGTLVICVLGLLAEPLYGYLLQQKLEAAGMLVEQNTLYPLLRRLEKQGLLESSWEIEESRPRRYYHLSLDGQEMYQTLIASWHTLNASVLGIIDAERKSL